MNITAKTRKTAIATLTALAVISAGAISTPTPAQAGNNALGALIGGAIIGGLIGAAVQPRYNTYTPAPVYAGCSSRWETRYNSYGQPYNVQVKYCY